MHKHRPDALSLLIDEHRVVAGLFSRLQDMPAGPQDADARERLARQICLLLTVHATVEAELFYPAAFDALEDGPFITQALREHRDMQCLIDELRRAEADAPALDAGMARLRRLFEAHVKEEEGPLFTRLAFTSLDVVVLGRRMRARRDDLLRRAGAPDGDVR